MNLFFFVSCKTTPEIKPSGRRLLCMFDTRRWVISIYSMIDVTGNFIFIICKLIGQFLNGNWQPLLLMVRKASWNFYQRFSRSTAIGAEESGKTQLCKLYWIHPIWHLFVLLFFELYFGPHNIRPHNIRPICPWAICGQCTASRKVSLMIPYAWQLFHDLKRKTNLDVLHMNGVYLETLWRRRENCQVFVHVSRPLTVAVCIRALHAN